MFLQLCPGLLVRCFPRNKILATAITLFVVVLDLRSKAAVVGDKGLAQLFCQLLETEKLILIVSFTDQNEVPEAWSGVRLLA